MNREIGKMIEPMSIGYNLASGNAPSAVARAYLQTTGSAGFI